MKIYNYIITPLKSHSHNPLIQVMCGIENHTRGPWEGSVLGSSFGLEILSVRFPLMGLLLL